MTAPTTLYKVLSADGRSCHGGNLAWPLPTQRDDGTWEPGAPVRVEGPLVPCKTGLHLATLRQVLTRWMGQRIWVAQWRGDLLDAYDKYVAREVRLLHPTAWDDRRARHFACDCAERALARQSNPDPRSVEVVRVARRFAEGRATRDELTAAYDDAAAYAAWDAAGDAAWDAAWAAAGDAAWDAARDAAGDAAWDAARAAVRAAAGAAAWAAAWDAARNWQETRMLHYLKGGEPDAY